MGLYWGPGQLQELLRGKPCIGSFTGEKRLIFEACVLNLVSRSQRILPLQLSKGIDLHVRRVDARQELVIVPLQLRVG